MSHNMIFEAESVVWVSLVGRDRKRLMIKEKHCDLVYEFQKWIVETRTFPYKTTTTGGGQWHGCFRQEDWPKVKIWLEKHGVVEERIQPAK